MQAESGKKYDLGKSRMALLPFSALRAVGDVLTYGAQKYKDNNWLGGMKWSRVQDAMLRHYERFAMGEDYDPEAPHLLHTAQIACNALFLLTYQLLDLGEDDRWKNRSDYVPADLEEVKKKTFEELDPEK